MILHKGREIVSFAFNDKAIAEIRRGTRLVWQAIRSCFGSGHWIGSRSWIGKDKWKGTNK